MQQIVCLRGQGKADVSRSRGHIVEVFPEVKKESKFLERRIAKAVVDAALVCKKELEGREVDIETRENLIDSVLKNPLTTAQLFLTTEVE